MHSTKDLLKSVFIFVLALALFLGFRWALYEPYVIPSGSMIPTLLVNDHIIVSKSAYGLRYPFSEKWITPPQLPKRGEIVVFKSVHRDDMFMIKRVVGLPGDVIEYTPGGIIRVNEQEVDAEPVDFDDFNYAFKNENELGSKLRKMTLLKEALGSDQEHYTLYEDYYESDEFEKYVVPEGQLFVMGDNRNQSHDSRYWGSFPVENLMGKALFVWLSCSETLPNISAICHPLHIRWSRFFHNLYK